MTTLSSGHVAVVCGGAAGIGYAIADELARKGMKLVLADRNGDALQSARQRLADNGTEVVSLTTDVSDRNAMRLLREHAVRQFGRVDLLCNSAGVFSSVGPVWTLDVDHWRTLLEVNYWAVVHGIREFVPLFIEQGFGYVVNIASMSGLSIVPGTADYISSKHATVSLSEALRADLDAAGLQAIGVTVVCPGAVRTAFAENAFRLMEQKLKATTQVTDKLRNSAIDPRDVAQATLAGIERNALIVTPNPGSRERVIARYEPILRAVELTADVRAPT